jgi:hypothetical protein
MFKKKLFGAQKKLLDFTLEYTFSAKKFARSGSGARSGSRRLFIYWVELDPEPHPRDAAPQQLWSSICIQTQSFINCNISWSRQEWQESPCLIFKKAFL